MSKASFDCEFRYEVNITFMGYPPMSFNLTKFHPYTLLVRQSIIKRLKAIGKFHLMEQLKIRKWIQPITPSNKNN